MTQSTLQTSGDPRLHVAIIMDGNGRWAAARGLPRLMGHRQGARAVRRVVKAAPGLGIGILTLYAFSCDNWLRPKEEVAGLMRLFRRYLRQEIPRCVAEGVRLQVIGRRDRLPAALCTAIEQAEAASAAGAVLLLRIAVDYSARDCIVRAAQAMKDPRSATRKTFAQLLGQASHANAPVPDVDLLVRTGGEQRLSDFLLWESAYAELVFTPRMWPDFTAADLVAALHDFQSRQRRFGRVLEASALSPGA